MVVMVSGIYGPSTGSIDARNHDNHDNHYNSPVLSTFFPEGHDNHYNSPVLRVFGKKGRRNCRETITTKNCNGFPAVSATSF